MVTAAVWLTFAMTWPTLDWEIPANAVGQTLNRRADDGNKSRILLVDTYSIRPPLLPLLPTHNPTSWRRLIAFRHTITPISLLPLSLIHISEPTRPTRISYAVFCLKKFFLMIRRPPRSTLSASSAASDVYKRQAEGPWFESASALLPLQKL